MTVKEVDIQAHLVDAAILLGGHAFKAQTEFGKGISDISCKMLLNPHCYIEVKLGKSNDLTVHQSEFIKDYMRAGGCGGWVRIWPGDRRGDYHLLVDAGINKTLFKPTDILPGQYFFKKAGQPWPILELVHHITANTP